MSKGAVMIWVRIYETGTITGVILTQRRYNSQKAGAIEM